MKDTIAKLAGIVLLLTIGFMIFMSLLTRASASEPTEAELRVDFLRQRIIETKSEWTTENLRLQEASEIAYEAQERMKVLEQLNITRRTEIGRLRGEDLFLPQN